MLSKFDIKISIKKSVFIFPRFFGFSINYIFYFYYQWKKNYEKLYIVFPNLRFKKDLFHKCIT